MDRRGLVVAAALTMAVACGPNPKAPVKVMALVPDESGAFTTTQVELATITNMTTLKGTVAEFIGGTRVVLDPNDPTQQLNGGIQNMPDSQRYDILVREKGGDVRGHFVDRSGVLWPGDFHTWNMVTTYYNFERSYDYFNFIYDGEDPKELRPMKVHYWNDVYLNSATPLTDNALYLSFIKGFVVVPFKTEQLVPLPMNIGVIGHEVAHRVFGFNALSDEGIHPALGVWSLEAFNWLKSLDEGLADFHGYAVTCREPAGCRPNFLALSLSDSRTVGFRNVSNANACMDDNLRNSFRSTSQAAWVASPDLYRVGNLVAVSLYQAGNKTGKMEVLEKALIKALDDTSTMTPGIRQLIEANKNDASLAQRNFTPEAVVDIIAAHITDPDLKKQVCTEFSTHMQLRCGQWPCMVDGLPSMPNCPATARRENTCPLLAQP